jgi:transcription elongation GreA/GreB family factor
VAKLYFTRKGADRIAKQRQALIDEFIDKQGQKGEAAEVGGNQWHDNFAFEQLSRDGDMLTTQIRIISEKIRNMMVVDDAPRDTSRLRIGHQVRLTVGQEEKICVVGGYEDSEPESTPPIVSYLAPMVAKLIGKEEGDSVEVTIGGQLKEITIVEISLPKPVEEETNATSL